MAWVLLDDNFPNHPKAVKAGPLGRDLFIAGLCYCRRFYTSGSIPSEALLSLGVATPKRLADKLVAVGLWDVAEGGFQIHDYDVIYADAEDKQRKDTNRANGRKGGIESRRLNALRSKPTGDGIGEGVSDLALEEKKCDADFETFWQRYPKKDGKQTARESWRKVKPDVETQRIMLADLDRRTRSAQWMKDGGQFIPHASTYLNQRRWEDGFTERPRLAERTVNVLKGWDDPAGSEVA